MAKLAFDLFECILVVCRYLKYIYIDTKSDARHPLSFIIAITSALAHENGGVDCSRLVFTYLIPCDIRFYVYMSFNRLNNNN